MSTLNQITLEVSQPTDSNILNSGGSDVEAESSSVFSTLMDQHKTERQSGKKTITDGNDEPKSSTSKKKEDVKDNSTRHDDATSEDKIEVKTHSNDTADNSIENEKVINEVAIGEQVGEEDTKKSFEDNANSNNTEVDDNIHNPEQLLSFLNASEKALMNKEQKSAIEGDALNHNIKSTDANIQNVVMEKESLENSESMETGVEIESNKTLIAQSVSANEDKTNIKAIKAAGENITAENKVIDALKNEDNTKENIKPDAQLSSKVMTEKTIDTAGKVNKDTPIEELNSLTQEYKTESSRQQLSQSELLVTPQNKLSKITDTNDFGENKINKVDVSNKFTQSDELLSQEALKAVNSETIDENKLKSVASVLPTNAEQLLRQTKDSSTASSIKADNNVKVEESIEVSDVSADELLSDDPKLKTPEAKLAQTLTPIASALFKNEIDNQSRLDTSTQDEHSFENVMQTMSADLTQTQKNTVFQQTETISLMRKDAVDAVKEKVMVMINQKIQQIDIQLDPPELGNMQVRINMQNEQAVVNFVVQNQQAKDALEQNMDKLKHMMSESGVDVGDANVDQQSKQSSAENQNEQGTKGSFNNQEGTSEAFIANENAKVIKASSTGVDYYV